MSFLGRLFRKREDETPSTQEERIARRAASRDEAAMIGELRVLCQRFAANEDGQDLVDLARAIGSELNNRGGMGAMRRVQGALGPIPEARTLDMVWNGIGHWMG